MARQLDSLLLAPVLGVSWSGLRLHASPGKVLVHQVQQHGRHIVLAALVPVAVHRQPVAQIPRLLPCAPREAALLSCWLPRTAGPGFWKTHASTG